MRLNKKQEFEVAKWQMLFGNVEVAGRELTHAGIIRQRIPIGFFRCRVNTTYTDPSPRPTFYDEVIYRLKPKEERERYLKHIDEATLKNLTL